MWQVVCRLETQLLSLKFKIILLLGTLAIPLVLFSILLLKDGGGV